MAGTERILVDKMNYLAENLNQDVTLITYEQGSHAFIFPLSNKVKHIDLNIKFFTVYKYNCLRRPYESHKLYRKFRVSLSATIKTILPDIIICTSYIPKELRVIAKIQINAVKLIESHLPKSHIWITEKRPYSPFEMLSNIYNKKYLNLVVKKFDAVVTLTKEDASLWKDTLATYIIPNTLTQFPKEISSCKNKKVIAAGRYHKQKGFDLLIDAWNEVHQLHSDWTLDIYNSNIDSKKDEILLTNQIKKFHLEQIVNLKESVSNIYDKYLDSSIYVLSSRFEGFALVLIEAMSCGVPCVAFDCPYGPRDIIKDGEDGILVKKMDSHNLARSICNLIEHEGERIEMGKKARENVKRYCKENIMPKWIELFEMLIIKKNNSHN